MILFKIHDSLIEAHLLERVREAVFRYNPAILVILKHAPEPGYFYVQAIYPNDSDYYFLTGFVAGFLAAEPELIA